MTKERILIVEDEGIVAADLEGRLNHLGYTVAGRAASGEQALQLAASTKPDLVLMDIILQGDMDGVEAGNQIVQQQSLPVVYLTAHADELTVRRAQDTGPFGYVLKPFDERELGIAIEIALYRSRVESKLRSLNRELQEALDHVKTLRGLLPICAWCKKIRDDDGYWKRLETYFRAHAEVEFSHGICPECLEKGLLSNSVARAKDR